MEVPVSKSRIADASRSVPNRGSNSTQPATRLGSRRKTAARARSGNSRYPSPRRRRCRPGCERWPDRRCNRRRSVWMRAERTDASVPHDRPRPLPLRVMRIDKGLDDRERRVPFRRGHQLLRLGRGKGDRLLAEHVLARLERADRPGNVQMVGQRIVNRLDLRVGQQRFVGAVGAGNPQLRRPPRSARDCSREAMATISQSSACCIAGMTLFTPMAAVLNTPQRTFCITSSCRRLAHAFPGFGFRSSLESPTLASRRVTGPEFTSAAKACRVRDTRDRATETPQVRRGRPRRLRADVRRSRDDAVHRHGHAAFARGRVALAGHALGSLAAAGLWHVGR